MILFIFKLYNVCVYTWLYACECRSIEARYIRSLRAWVTGSCDLPDIGAGNWTLVLWKHKSMDSELMNPLNSPALPPQRFCFDIFELFCLFLIFGMCCCCSAVSCQVALLLHLSFTASHRFLPCRSISGPKLLPAWRTVFEHRHRQGLFDVCLVWCCHKCGRKSHIRECSSPHYVSVHPRILQGWTQWYFVPLGKLPEKLGGSAESLIPGFQSTQGDAFATSSFSAGTGKCDTCLRHEDHCCFHFIDSSSIWRTQFLVVSHYFPSFSSCPAKRHLRTTKNHFEFRCWSAVVNIQYLLSPFSVCLM